MKDLHHRSVASRNWLRKLETTGSLLTQHAGGRKMSEETTHDVKERLLASPSKSLRRLSQETNIPYSTCQRAAKKANLRVYRVSRVQELLPTDHEKRVRFCLWIKDFLTQNPGILDVTFFYRRSMASSERILKLSRHAYMGSRKPSYCA